MRKSKKGPSLGIDVGSLYIKIVGITEDNGVEKSAYIPHMGRPIRALKGTIGEFLNEKNIQMGITGALSAAIAEQLGIEPIDLVRAEIEAVRGEFPDITNIIDVGGGSVTLIRLNERGEFEGMTQNSLCAAGTGSFLDEQAVRLDISYDELNSFSKVSDPPQIATRCAVFAKSDLIHHQQAGRTRAECWSGLCKGMVGTLLSTLLKGRPLSGKTVIVGGVSLNEEIMFLLKGLYGDDIMTFPEAHLAGAIGAGSLSEDVISTDRFFKLQDTDSKKSGETLSTRPPLNLKISDYPSWEVEESYTDEMSNEVRVTSIPKGPIVSCLMGIDIGSTSTKLLITDTSGNVICDIYRMTMGDPIGAVTNLFSALLDLAKVWGVEIDVKGCVTTGSGRKMIGLLVGADKIINEISCHIKGAMNVDATIETIFEIGGQDSKYMRTQNGKIKDAAMNYVCAAGTGSFVEEAGRKLGFNVSDIGDAVMGIAPPHTSDRCTVFMDQDVRRLLRSGYSKEEALAAVLYSVVQNYLNKVVARRHYSKEKIFFQGATARNSGLVAAFENLLGVKMVVSPYAHVMGAWGAALIANDLIEDGRQKTNFRGLDLLNRKIELKTERCDLCTNNCEITKVIIEGTDEVPSWGYMCGREPGEKKKSIREYRHFQSRERLLLTTGSVDLPKDAPKVAVPKALSMYSFLPMWRRFFGELGYRLITSPATNQEIKTLGVEITGGEFCFPVKAALGHARWAFERTDVDYVLIPYTLSNKPNKYTSNSYFCPYVQTYPSLVKNALELHGINHEKLITPIVDLRWKKGRQVDEFLKSIGGRLNVGKNEIKKAWDAACKSQEEFETACTREGEKALNEIKGEEKPAIVVLGRPYNTMDIGINLDLIRKIAEKGHTVIPIDYIKFNPKELGEEFENIYWDYPQKIIHAIKETQENPMIYPVFFTNFNCGPDSFIETYSDFLADEKPMLFLGLDEHDADAGYVTRIEAFLDVINNASVPTSSPKIESPPMKRDDFKRRTIWIPNMHNIGTRLGAAAFRNFGYDAKVLPLETDESYEVGRQLTSGNECLPTVVTIGAFVSKLREINAKPGEHAFFMGTTSGPCRFGQFVLKHRMILNELGYSDIPIMYPSAENSYQGMPQILRKHVWKLFIASDILMKLRCKTAPYESNPGETEKVLDMEVDRLSMIIETGGDFDHEWIESLKKIDDVPKVNGPKKPLVGIVGEVYVRCNSFTNDRVIQAVERMGGEVWLAPLSEWFLYTSFLQNWRNNSTMLGAIKGIPASIKNSYIHGVEHKLYEEANKWVGDRIEPDISDIIDCGKEYLPLNFEGESILTLGRTIKFIDDKKNKISLVINCAPFGCMPGTITGSIFQEIQNRKGVPIVNIYYDGEGDLNDIIGVYLAQA